MFSKPKHGWTDILIGDFEGLGSYIQDIPLEAMRAFLTGLKEGGPVKLHFDEEGSEFTLLAGETTQIAAKGEGGVQESSENISMLALAKELAEDMEAYFEEWVKWPPEYSFFEDDQEAEKQAFYEERAVLLKELLGELKEELKKVE